MTIRERLNRNKRRQICYYAAAILVLFAGLFLGPLLGAFGPFAPLAGLALAFVGLVYVDMSSAFRCSRCGKSLGRLVMQKNTNLFVINEQMRYCPFCGVDFDSEETLKRTAKEDDPLD
ncbi:hypothetical protein [Paludisphaera soli]|uniref:hypothetical protein n=1 Tax=Paludisphaera soli TaxID=2712865 RepID=UPI0013ECF989|nr:hypothetical protein [Paludisphaera soli]